MKRTLAWVEARAVGIRMQGPETGRMIRAGNQKTVTATFTHGTVRAGANARATLRISFRILPWRLPPAAERTFRLDLWQFPTSVLDRYNDANPGAAACSKARWCLLEPFYRYLAAPGPAGCDRARRGRCPRRAGDDPVNRC